MSPTDEGAEGKRIGPEASAHTGAEAVAFINRHSSHGKEPSIEEMAAIARQLRRHIVRMTGKAGSGHPGAQCRRHDPIGARRQRRIGNPV